MEGIGQANIENWQNVFSGAQLTYTVTTGLTSTKQYRFRVRSKSEYDKQSLYSEVSVFYAAALPEQIVFESFTDFSKSKFTLNWVQPVINTETMLPIIAYRVYWDAGYLLPGNYELLATVNSYDQYFYVV